MGCLHCALQEYVAFNQALVPWWILLSNWSSPFGDGLLLDWSYNAVPGWHEYNCVERIIRKHVSHPACYFREQAPISSSLNAVDLYLVVCIFFVFAALIEYAVILLLLKKRRKPRRTIDEGLMTMFQSTAAPTATGAATNGAGEGPSSGPSGPQQSVRDKKVPVRLSLTNISHYANSCQEWCHLSVNIVLPKLNFRKIFSTSSLALRRGSRRSWTTSTPGPCGSLRPCLWCSMLSTGSPTDTWAPSSSSSLERTLCLIITNRSPHCKLFFYGKYDEPIY